MTKEMLKKNTPYREGTSFDRWFFTGRIEQDKRWNYKTNRLEEVTVYIMHGEFDAMEGFTEEELKRFKEA